MNQVSKKYDNKITAQTIKDTLLPKEEKSNTEIITENSNQKEESNKNAEGKDNFLGGMKNIMQNVMRQNSKTID
jgi:hypothetical protein